MKDYLLVLLCVFVVGCTFIHEGTRTLKLGKGVAGIYGVQNGQIISHSTTIINFLK